MSALRGTSVGVPDEQLGLLDSDDAAPAPYAAGKILVIDSMAFLYRAHYALPELTNGRGQPTGAAYGFFSTLLDLLNAHLPTYAFAAFESFGPTFRHARYAPYKAQRRTTPEPLVAQIPVVEQLAAEAGLGVLRAEGFEADDVIAALAAHASETHPLVIASGDRDLFQLLGEYVSIAQPSRPGTRGLQLIGTEAFRQRYLLEPRQWVERRALEGDSSDNLPGVPGIGEKTASDLIRRYVTLEDVYTHLDDLSPGARRRLEAGRESALLTRELARLRADCAHVDLEAGRLTLHDDAPLQAHLADLAFRSFGPRWAHFRAQLRSRGS